MNRLGDAWDRMNPDEASKSRMRERLIKAQEKKEPRAFDSAPQKPLYRLAWSTAVVATLTACLIIVGISYYLKTGGRQIGQGPIEYLGGTSEPVMQSLDYYACRLLEQKPEDEFWIISWGSNEAHVEMSQQVNSFDELCERIATAHGDIVCPIKMPSGYIFIEGRLSFHYTRQTVSAERLTEETIQTSAGELKKTVYKVSANDRDGISGYYMLFRNLDGEELRIQVDMSENVEPDFGTSEGGRVESVQIDGMDSARLSENANEKVIFTYRLWNDPLIYESIYSIT